MLILEGWGSGDIHQGLAHGERSLAIARELGLKEQMAFTLTNLVSANIALSRLEAASQAVLEARGIWLELGNTPMVADSYGLAGTDDAQVVETTEALDERIRAGKRTVAISALRCVSSARTASTKTSQNAHCSCRRDGPPSP